MTRTTYVPIYVNDFQISHVSYDNFFKAGLAFRFYVKVARPDGKPVIDKLNSVKVGVSYGLNDVQNNVLSLMLNDQGMTFVSVTVPLSTVRLDFEVIFFFVFWQRDTYNR
jgi:hypothetical protein